MTSGNIYGTGTLTLNSSMSWTGGTISGILDIASAATLTFSNGGSWKYLSDLTLNNAGTIIWNNGPLALQDSSTINNESGALFDIQQGNTIQTQDSGDASVSAFDNAGTLRLETGSGTTTFQAAGNGAKAILNNTGTVDVEGGTLNLSDGGSNSATGTFAVASAGLVQFSGGTFTLNSGTTITGVGYSQVTGGTLTIAGAVTADTFELTGGAVSGTGTLTVNSAMSWTGGTESGTLDIGSAGTLTFSNGGSWKYLSDLTLNNAGTIIWNNGPLALQDSSTINNESGALFDIQQGNTIQTQDSGDASVSAFDNAGTLRLETGSGTTTFQAAGNGAKAILNNTGTVDVEGGTLNLSDGGSNSATGTFAVASAGLVQFSGGTFTLDGGSTFTGNGYSQVTNGTVDIAGNVTAATFELSGGTVSGSGTLTVDSAMSWTGGTESGTLDIGSAGTLTFSNGGSWKYLSDLTLNNAGTIIWNNGPLALQDSSTINNESGALFDIQVGNNIQTQDGSDTSVSAFDNAGTLRLETGSGTTTFQAAGNGAKAILNNTGTVDVEGGTLNLSDGGTNSATGTFAIASAGLVQFSGGNLHPRQWLDPYRQRLCPGEGASVDIAGAVSADTLEMTSGNIYGTGTLTLNSSMSWTGGTISGILDIASAATLTFSNGGSWKYLSDLTLNNAGTIIWNNGPLALQDSSTIDNESGALFGHPGRQQHPDPGFQRHRRLGGQQRRHARLDEGSGTTTFASSPWGRGATAVLNNTGTVQVNGGTLNLSDGGSNSATGTFAIASAGLVQFSGGTFTLDSGSTLTGSGYAQVNGASVDIAGAVSADTLR